MTHPNRAPSRQAVRDARRDTANRRSALLAAVELAKKNPAPSPDWQVQVNRALTIADELLAWLEEE